MEYFEPSSLLSPDDEKMRLFGTVEKLAQWRHRGRGPAYIKVGRKIMYLGADLNDYLTKRRVVTSCHAKIEAKQRAKKARQRRAKFEAGGDNF